MSTFIILLSCQKAIFWRNRFYDDVRKTKINNEALKEKIKDNPQIVQGEREGGGLILRIA